MTDGRHPAQWLQAYYTPIWWLLCALFAIPALQMCWHWYANSLGANPLETLTQQSGLWSLNLLLLTMALTPLRRLLTFVSVRGHMHYGKRLSDWNRLIRLRRMIGVWSFAYAALHVWLWLEFDAGWHWPEMIRAMSEKPYLLLGLIAFVCVSLLAATSFNAAVRVLRRNWKYLHRLVYVAAIAVALHFLWMSKPGRLTLPAIYAVAVTLLLGYRFMSRCGWFWPRLRDDGDEVPERAKKDGAASRRPG